MFSFNPIDRAQASCLQANSREKAARLQEGENGSRFASLVVVETASGNEAGVDLDVPFQDHQILGIACSCGH
jgi:hypothetical protein